MRAAERPGAVDLCKVPEVIFPNWRELLNQADLPVGVRAGYGLAIGGYLEYCHGNGVSVTAESARGWVAGCLWGSRQNGGGGSLGKWDL